MLKYAIYSCYFLFAFLAHSQTTIIAIQTFDETDPEWNYTSTISFFDNNSDGFFGIHDGDNDNDTNDTGISGGANAIT